MKLYGTLLCPDCPPVISALKSAGIEFEFVNIMENIQGLKEFLQLRDSRYEFNEVKSAGNIGIPCLLVNEKTILFGEDIIEHFAI